MWIKEIIRRRIDKRFDKRLKEARRLSEEIFQVREYDGRMWVTYRDNLVCPSEMLNGDILTCLTEMRRQYMLRKESMLREYFHKDRKFDGDGT